MLPACWAKDVAIYPVPCRSCIHRVSLRWLHLVQWIILNWYLMLPESSSFMASLLAPSGCLNSCSFPHNTGSHGDLGKLKFDTEVTDSGCRFVVIPSLARVRIPGFSILLKVGSRFSPPLLAALASRISLNCFIICWLHPTFSNRRLSRMVSLSCLVTLQYAAMDRW